MIITLWMITTLSFFMMNSLPGDPISSTVNKLPKQVQINMRKTMGLDKPIYIRYFVYMGNLLKGDLGQSLTDIGMSANKIIKINFPASFRLGINAVIVGVFIGVLFGIIAAFNNKSWVDFLIMIIAILGVSIPGFVVAAVLQSTLGKVLPPIGWPTHNQFFGGVKYTILPIIALSYGSIATYARYTKTSILEVINQDYILTAEAKGLPRNRIILKHILRNAMLPVITILGPHIAGIITGSFIIESIFAVPGLGKYFIYSIAQRDYTMIMATTVFFSALFMLSLLIVDILYVLIDPRIKFTNKSR